jgi:hypothetical protein
MVYFSIVLSSFFVVFWYIIKIMERVDRYTFVNYAVSIRK